MNILLGKVGFFAASIAYFISFILLFLTHTKSTKKTLLASSFLIIMFSLLISALVIHFDLNYHYILMAETFRSTIWMVILMDALDIFSKNSKTNESLKHIKKSLLLLLPLIEIIFFFLYENQTIIFISHLILTISVILLVEQLYKKTNHNQKWKIKPLCVGLGLIFIYDFAFYSDALLLHNLDINILFVKGWISLLALPLILMTIRRIKNWTIRIYISRDIVFSSTLLIASGFYLAFMSIAGYLIRYLDYSWTNLAQHIFFATSFILFLLLFLSNQLRIKLKKFIIYHFYENKYDHRQEWLDFSKNLEAQSKSIYQTALNSMMKPFACDAGILFEMQTNKMTPKAEYNINNLIYLNILTELSNKALKENKIINLNEVSRETKNALYKYRIEKIIKNNKIQHIIPIAEPGNTKYICMLSKINHNNEPDFEDEDLLNVLSKQLSISLNLHLANEYLIENQQFNAFNQMSTFLVHDLKNILAQLELISKNSKKHKDNKMFIEDTFITIDSASNRLNKVVSQLVKRKPQEYSYEWINVNEVILNAYEERKHFQPRPVIVDNFKQAIFIKTDKEKLINIFLNLIKNAQDACNADGKVHIYQIPNKEYFAIAIEDNGVGMSEEFIANRLFKPFDTTKGNAGLGVGAFDAKKFIEQMDGYLEVTSHPNLGSKFEIYLPIQKQNSVQKSDEAYV